jgi:hypothetical protein
MAGNNLLWWNTGAANQETDSAFASDSQRTGGAANPSLFPSILANKLFYNWGNFISAFGLMMANKGYLVLDNPSGTPFSGTYPSQVIALAAVLANVQTAADTKSIQTVSFSSSMALSATGHSGFYIPMTSNCAFTITGLTAWAKLKFIWGQPAAGNCTVSFPGNVTAGVGGLPTQPDPTPNSFSTQDWIVFPDGNLHPDGPMIVS